MLLPLQHKVLKDLCAKVTKVEKSEEDGIIAVKLTYLYNEQSAAKPEKEGSETIPLGSRELFPEVAANRKFYG